MNEFQLHQQHAEVEAAGGALCKGDECPGWFPTQLDTWVQCSCGRNGDRHPEDDWDWAEEKEIVVPRARPSASMLAPLEYSEVPF